MQPRCPSCNKKYTKHMGLHGLCKLNIELKKQVGQLREALLKKLDTSEYMFEVIKELKLRGYPEIENRNSAKKEVQDLIALVEKLAESKHQAEISELRNEQFVKESRYEQEILDLKAKVKRLECGIDQSQEYFKELQKWGRNVASAGSVANQVRAAIDHSFNESKRKWEAGEKSFREKTAELEKELKEARSVDSAMGIVRGYVYSNLRAHSTEANGEDDLSKLRKDNAEFLKEGFERFSSIFSEYQESVESDDPVVIHESYEVEKNLMAKVRSLTRRLDEEKGARGAMSNVREFCNREVAEYNPKHMDSNSKYGPIYTDNAIFLKEEYEKFFQLGCEYLQQFERGMIGDNRNCVDNGPTNLREKYVQISS